VQNLEKVEHSRREKRIGVVVTKIAKQTSFLHLLYDETRGNSRPARRPYGERYPEGVLPSRCTFVELHLHLCEVGSD
jgi:hypothetical protein